MRARELLLECKIAKNVSTDYALAGALKIPRERISDYMAGRRVPDKYACFRIAEALGREPSDVIAEIEAETDEKHREFWRDFLQRRGLLGLAAGISLLSCSVFYAPDAGAAELLSNADAHNDTLRQRRKRPLTAVKTAFGRFFYACSFPQIRGINQGFTDGRGGGCLLRLDTLKIRAACFTRSLFVFRRAGVVPLAGNGKGSGALPT